MALGLIEKCSVFVKPWFCFKCSGFDLALKTFLPPNISSFFSGQSLDRQTVTSLIISLHDA